jgi:peptidoglycan/xylan/chitin deacetylase (PgdA/CDA1 family)
MPSKKEMLAQAAAFSGITRALDALPHRPSLLILNYHRIGDKELTPYDAGLFSCTGEEFDWQVGWLKSRFSILTLDQAADIIHGRGTPARTAVLLTFDDGYRDNFQVAFPILERHGVSATFFLPTAFVGTGKLPWWDEIAWMVKRSPRPSISIRYPVAATFELPAEGRGESVFEVLKVFKGAPSIDTERFLDELATAAGCPRPGDDSERCFLNFDEARAMQSAGMCFGSHTHTHEILGRLPYQRQVEELATSRGILESELRRNIDTLAYPVGKSGTFSEETFKALRETRYNTAFSFYSGINPLGSIEPYSVLRTGVDGESRDLFRLRASLYATAGRSLV